MSLKSTKNNDNKVLLSKVEMAELTLRKNNVLKLCSYCLIENYN